MFVVLLTRVILSYKLDFLIPLSKVRPRFSIAMGLDICRLFCSFINHTYFKSDLTYSCSPFRIKCFSLDLFFFSFSKVLIVVPYSAPLKDDGWSESHILISFFPKSYFGYGIKITAGVQGQSPQWDQTGAVSGECRWHWTIIKTNWS